MMAGASVDDHLPKGGGGGRGEREKGDREREREREVTDERRCEVEAKVASTT